VLVPLIMFMIYLSLLSDPLGEETECLSLLWHLSLWIALGVPVPLVLSEYLSLWFSTLGVPVPLAYSSLEIEAECLSLWCFWITVFIKTEKGRC